MNALPAWVVPAPSLLNDPPAAMKALCNFKMHSLALHLACFSKTEVFFVGSSEDDCAESNMQTGQDDEDLQKALALSLEPGGGLTSAESNMHSGQDDEDLQKALAFW